MEFYLAIDLSLTRSGYTVADSNRQIIEIGNIKTNSKYETPIRLFQIWDFFKDLQEDFKFDVVILERGFTQFHTATQQLFRVHGIINLLFKDSKQIYYTPAKIKKSITGNGKAKKEEVYKELKKIYPNVVCKNHDESDSLAIMCNYLKETKGDI